MPAEPTPTCSPGIASTRLVPSPPVAGESVREVQALVLPLDHLGADRARRAARDHPGRSTASGRGGRAAGPADRGRAPHRARPVAVRTGAVAVLLEAHHGRATFHVETYPDRDTRPWTPPTRRSPPRTRCGDTARLRRATKRGRPLARVGGSPRARGAVPPASSRPDRLSRGLRAGRVGAVRPRWATGRRTPPREVARRQRVLGAVPQWSVLATGTAAGSVDTVTCPAAVPSSPHGGRSPRSAGAPSGIRTHTGSGLSRTPLPIGLSGPRSRVPRPAQHAVRRSCPILRFRH